MKSNVVRQASELTLGAVVAIVVYAAGSSLWTPSADAATAPACFERSPRGDDDYGQYTVGESSDHSNGTRADVWFPHADAACQRISSIGVVSATGNGVWEFGWVLGWSTVDDQFHPVPTMFCNSRNTLGDRGGFKVWDNRNPSRGDFHQIRASDLNSNTFWGGWVDGNGGFDPAVNLDFSEGTTYVNVERGSSADGFGSEFKSIEEHGSNWNDTDNLTSHGWDPDWRSVVDPNEHHLTITRR